MHEKLIDLFEKHMEKIAEKLGLKSCTITNKDTKVGNYYELSIVHPAINLYLHFLSGVLYSLQQSNIVVATASLRGMLESIATIAYFETNDPDNNVYNRFLKNGRIYRKVSSRWEETSKRQQVKSIEPLAGKNFVGLYDLFCLGIHFSNIQFYSTIDGFNAKRKGIITRIGMNRMNEEEITTFLEIITEFEYTICAVLDNMSNCMLPGSNSYRRFSYTPNKSNLFSKSYLKYLSGN